MSAPDIWENLRDSDEVVITLQPTTAVYTNPEGAVVIRQRSAEFDDDADPYVFVRPENFPLIVRRLLIEVGLEGLLVRGFPQGPYLADPRAGEYLENDEPDARPARAVSAAERQRRYRERHRHGGVTRDVTRDAPTLQLEHEAAE